MPVLARYAAKLDWDPRREIKGFADLSRVPARSKTSGSAAGRCSAGCPRGSQGKPVYVFETGGTTGIPKTRVAFEDFRTDYELFSDTLPDEYFPRRAPTG